jgi:hypothetical protein
MRELRGWSSLPHLRLPLFVQTNIHDLERVQFRRVPRVVKPTPRIAATANGHSHESLYPNILMAHGNESQSSGAGGQRHKGACMQESGHPGIAHKAH